MYPLRHVPLNDSGQASEGQQYSHQILKKHRKCKQIRTFNFNITSVKCSGFGLCCAKTNYSRTLKTFTKVNISDIPRSLDGKVMVNVNLEL